MKSSPLFQKVFVLRRPRLAIFTDIIKVTTIFIKEAFNDSNRFKKIENYVLKWNLHLSFLI